MACRSCRGHRSASARRLARSRPQLPGQRLPPPPHDTSVTMVDYSRFNNIVIDSDSEESSDDEPARAPARAPAPTKAPPRRHYEAVMAEYQCLYFPEAVACLSRGEAYSRTFEWCPPSPPGAGGSGGSGGGAWSIRTRRGPILKNSIMNSTDNSHIGWKRELNLTLHAGQHLPEAMYGGMARVWRGHPQASRRANERTTIQRPSSTGHATSQQLRGHSRYNRQPTTTTTTISSSVANSIAFLHEASGGEWVGGVVFFEHLVVSASLLLPHRAPNLFA